MIQTSSNKIHKAFWLLSISIMLALTLPMLIRHGMFMDSMLYISVAHNLGRGIGTFWFPFFDAYNVANLPSFHEQPPLVFGIESLFFKVLGDSRYVERFYTFLMMCLTAFMIQMLWLEIYKNNTQLKKMAWLPIVLWISIPVCFWSFSNAMHENTMGIFVMASVLFMYKALESKSKKFGLWIFAACCISLAFLSKGFPGLFPLGVPFFYWLFMRKKSFAQISLYSLILLLTLITIGFALYLYPDSNKSLSIYLFKRAFQRISSVPSVDSRFFILWRLCTELIPQVLFTLLFFGIAKFKKLDTDFSQHQKTIFFFFSIGLSGSLPLMLTKVQNGFYFVPSLPFFGIAFACLSAPIILKLIQQIPIKFHTALITFSGIILLGVCVFSWTQHFKFSRDKDLLNDVYWIGNTVSKNTRINCTYETYQNWELNCYLVRNYDVSLNCISIDSTSHDYFISLKAVLPDTSFHVKQIPLPTIEYNLYKKESL